MFCGFFSHREQSLIHQTYTLKETSDMNLIIDATSEINKTQQMAKETISLDEILNLYLLIIPQFKIHS
jgi:hypothetical protein